MRHIGRIAGGLARLDRARRAAARYLEAGGERGKMLESAGGMRRAVENSRRSDLDLVPLRLPGELRRTENPPGGRCRPDW